MTDHWIAQTREDLIVDLEEKVELIVGALLNRKRLLLQLISGQRQVQRQWLFQVIRAQLNLLYHDTTRITSGCGATTKQSLRKKML